MTEAKQQQHKVLIIGGGAAGISVAARLAKKLPANSIAIVEPSTTHHYQPLWTLVGGGVGTREATERAERTLIPAGVTWIQDRVTKLEPEQNRVVLQSGGALGYEWLVVCPGIQLDWKKVEGLEGNVGKHGICSNYSYDTVQHTWPTIEATRSGPALFTHPNTPIKCGGAPQKIMYLAESTFRRRGVRQAIDVHFVSGMPESFTVPHYARVLDKVMSQRDITPHYLLDLVAIRPEQKVAVFARVGKPEERVEMPYSMIHVTPPMSAPDFVKQSPLANAGGWCDIDKGTLRSPKFPNVFALGDASSAPTSKTGAAIRKQAPVVAQNLLAAIEGKPTTATYDGYTSCPLVTDYGKLILAEFDYDKKLKETFPFDQSKERWSMYMLKKHVLPQLYWRGMLKGRA
ncbi:MAG: NAD(P)/FAD-dependent oxidoreductase [Planctomycetes bacterium]|nr:NAD(P)/FAD-dependent oxidoreductase [Planctomycetota bacterium]